MEPPQHYPELRFFKGFFRAIHLASARTALLETLFRAIHSYSTTSSLAFLSSVPRDDLIPLFRARTDSALNPLMSKLPNDPNFIEQVKEHTSVYSVAGTQNAIAAACLVFSHSLADVSVEELCSIVADFDTAYWSATVSKQTITLGTITKRGADVLVRERIRQKINKMSLPTKMKHLLRNAGNHSNIYYPNFSYDKGRLAKLDASRHDIIHREGITLNVEDTKDSQEVFFKMTVYACLVVSSMLGLGVTYPNLYVEWLEHLLKKGCVT